MKEESRLREDRKMTRDMPLGPNKTFNDLNDWNQQVTENEWANELVFIGLNIVPVYSLAYLADIVVFNSIEFWDGDDM